MRLTLLSASLLCAATLSAQQATIVNGASFRGEQPLTSGSWAAAFGTFTGVTTTTFTGTIPTSLGGVSITVESTPAPVAFVSATQINFLIPYAVTPGLHPVVVSANGATFTGSVRIITAAPGLFLYNPANLTPPQAAVVNIDDNSVNDATHAAKRGSYISLYGTGPGALDGVLADGAFAPADPLIRTVSSPLIYIGGVLVALTDVQFSGLAPGYAGLWQINVKVPADVPVAGRVSVQLYINGVDANEVSIFVQ